MSNFRTSKLVVVAGERFGKWEMVTYVGVPKEPGEFDYVIHIPNANRMAGRLTQRDAEDLNSGFAWALVMLASVFGISETDAFRKFFGTDVKKAG